MKAPRRARAERLPWLLADARDAQLTDLTDGLWVRLFDVAAALAARTYEREGRMVIEVVDARAGGGPVPGAPRRRPRWRDVRRDDGDAPS